MPFLLQGPPRESILLKALLFSISSFCSLKKKICDFFFFFPEAGVWLRCCHGANFPMESQGMLDVSRAKAQSPSPSPWGEARPWAVSLGRGGGGLPCCSFQLCLPAPPGDAHGVKTQQSCWSTVVNHGGLCEALRKGFKYTKSSSLIMTMAFICQITQWVWLFWGLFSLQPA